MSSVWAGCEQAVPGCCNPGIRRDKTDNITQSGESPAIDMHGVTHISILPAPLNSVVTVVIPGSDILRFRAMENIFMWLAQYARYAHA